MHRRIALKTLTAPLAAGLLHSAQRTRTVLAALETFQVKVNRRGNWLLFRLRTTDGLTGIGDASHGGDDNAASSFGKQFFEAIKGRSIFDIEYLRKIALPVVEESKRPATVALSGLEQCLWDLQGQALDIPAYQLFGGALQQKIRNYANINRSTEERSPEGFAKMAAAAVKAGFDAIKLAPFDDMPSMNADAKLISEFTDLGVARTKAVRDAIGPERDLLIDVHSHLNLQRGLDLAKRLEPLKLFWLEEVCRSFEDLAVINKAAAMPTAGGESVFGVRGFYAYISAQAVDTVMPDVKYCGGMLELKKIAALAEAAGLPVAPHGPASPVGNMAAAHVCATLPNFQILEYSFGEVPWRAELVDPPEQVVNGFLNVSERKGFGISLNEKTISQHAV